MPVLELFTSDINIWKSFESSGYLDHPYSYLLSINVDWFQPFKHTTYSFLVVGFISQYKTFLGLRDINRKMYFSLE